MHCNLILLENEKRRTKRAISTILLYLINYSIYYITINRKYDKIHIINCYIIVTLKK